MDYKHQQWVILLTWVNFFTKAHARLVGLRTLDQHRAICWRLRWAYELNDVAQGHFTTLSQQYSQQSANVVPTNDCYLEKSGRKLPVYNLKDNCQFTIWETLTIIQYGRQLPVYNLEDTYQFTIWETLTSVQSGRHLPVYNLGDTYQFTIWETLTSLQSRRHLHVPV